MKENIGVIEYKYTNKNVSNTRIFGLFSNKFSKKNLFRSIKDYIDNGYDMRDAFFNNSILNTIPRNIKHSALDVKLKEWADMVENQCGF